MRCGLLGRVLGHSYSPMIHGMLGQYSYDLFPTEPEALDALLRGDAWDGLNVTIPYKKTVVPYCAELSETAEKLGMPIECTDLALSMLKKLQAEGCGSMDHSALVKVSEEAAGLTL